MITLAEHEGRIIQRAVARAKASNSRMEQQRRIVSIEENNRLFREEKLQLLEENFALKRRVRAFMLRFNHSLEPRPIETAPKDGTPIDVWDRFGFRTTGVRWYEKEGAWFFWRLDDFDLLIRKKVSPPPTRWLPTPPAPVKGDEDA